MWVRHYLYIARGLFYFTLFSTQIQSRYMWVRHYLYIVRGLYLLWVRHYLYIVRGLFWTRFNLMLQSQPTGKPYLFLLRSLHHHYQEEALYNGRMLSRCLASSFTYSNNNSLHWFRIFLTEYDTRNSVSNSDKFLQIYCWKQI